jgi:hypothetical protein
MKNLFSIACLCACTILTSCSNNDDVNPNVGSLTLEFDNIVGSANLQLNTADEPYTNGKGEAYKVTHLTYIVSNIKLKREDDTIFTDPVRSDGSAGYYLVDEDDLESQEIVLENIPAGSYTEATFTLGVDAAQVDQGAQTGALDPAHGMFWSWNSGYIFLMLEGESPVSTETGKVFQYHVGGYKEDPNNAMLVNNVKTITLSFGDDAPVRAEHRPEVHTMFDVSKFLDGTGEEVTFTANASRHMPKVCQDLANNIAGAFRVDHVHAN